MDQAGLIEHMTGQFHYLVASAVVIETAEGFLEPEMENIFVREIALSKALQVWEEFRDSVMDANPDRQAAFETIWLLACFTRALREIAV